ncbi:MAG: NlpC/P60 family protein [Desulfobacteraceae bacterium]
MRLCPHRFRRTRLPGIQYTLQVGAFSAMERAAAFASELNQKGLDAYYFIDEDGLSKVRFERFDSREAACQRAFRLQALGWIDDFFVIQPAESDHRIDRRLSLGRKIVRTAGRFLGTAYRWGGESADAGFDCSGLTMTVYRLNGLDLPRNSRDQFRAGTPVKRSTLRQGDLVFFATGRRSPRVTHVGIYTGGGRFIHAPGRGKTIRSASLANGYFKRRFVGARRYF